MTIVPGDPPYDIHKDSLHPGWSATGQLEPIWPAAKLQPVWALGASLGNVLMQRLAEKLQRVPPWDRSGFAPIRLAAELQTGGNLSPGCNAAAVQLASERAVEERTSGSLPGPGYRPGARVATTALRRAARLAACGYKPPGRGPATLCWPLPHPALARWAKPNCPPSARLNAMLLQQRRGPLYDPSRARTEDRAPLSSLQMLNH